MSWKSRNASQNASKTGLSGLALGSLTLGLSGLLHAQNAQPQQPAGSAAKPKASRGAPAGSRGRPATRSALRLAQAATTGNGNATVPAPTTSAATLQEIVVTGIRGSLQRALQIKKMSMGVVDAISAEDIGQFPDSSIGQAIARIPGVTVDRGGVNTMSAAGAQTSVGGVTGVTVRGFGSTFNEALTEGRPVGSALGQNFDFSSLGSQWVGEVDVLKTPDFSLSTGTIGATINIKFPNPFDHPGPQARAYASTTDYANDGAFRPSFGALFSDTFDDGKFGVLFDADYDDHHVTAHHIDIVGWGGTYLNSCQMAGGPACTRDASGNLTTPTNTKPSWFIQDMAMYLDRTDERRKDGRLAFQWHPTDAVLVTLDDNYSSDDQHTDRWQYSTWFNSGALSNVTQDSNGTITDFTTGPNPADFNAFVADTYLVTNTPGLNVLWDVSDDWSAELDADQSMSKLNPNHDLTDIDVDVGYGPSTPLGTNGYTGGVGISNSSTVPYWTAYGPNNNAANFLGMNPYLIGSHVTPLQEAIGTDKVNQVKLDATWHTGSTKVNFGGQFVDDTYDTEVLDDFDFSGSNGEWQMWSGYGPASNNYYYWCGQVGVTACKDQSNPPAGAIPTQTGYSLPQSLFTPVSLSNFIPGMNGNDKLPPGLLMYNPYAVMSYLESQKPNASWGPANGYPYYSGGLPAVNLNVGTVSHIERRYFAPFVTAEHNFTLGDMELKADAGLRYQKTDVTVAGLLAPLDSLGLQPSDHTAYLFTLGAPTYKQDTNSYHYLLPSLDLNLMVRPDFKVRFDASRTERDPPNADLSPDTTYGGRVNALNGTSGNPYLLPYLADNLDLGAEWYYAQNDYLSADTFFKHVTQFPIQGVEDQTLPNVIDPSPYSTGYGKPVTFAITTTVNGEAANVDGIEVTWQQMLMYGFGFQINGTYVHTNKPFDPNNIEQHQNQFALPGIGNSANFIGFYQRNGLQARLAVQWQGEQFLSFGQEQNISLFGTEPTFLEASTEVDFSTTYDINSHLSAFFEALNLTDAEYHTRGRFSNQTLNLIDYGRSFTIGVRAKM